MPARAARRSEDQARTLPRPWSSRIARTPTPSAPAPSPAAPSPAPGSAMLTRATPSASRAVRVISVPGGAACSALSTHFINASPTEALEAAREAAGGLEVRIGGGPSTVRQFLAADLIDHLHIVVVPVILGRGERIWDGLEELEQRFTSRRWAPPGGVAHVAFTRRSAARGSAADVAQAGHARALGAECGRRCRISSAGRAARRMWTHGWWGNSSAASGLGSAYVALRLVPVPLRTRQPDRGLGCRGRISP